MATESSANEEISSSSTFVTKAGSEKGEELRQSQTRYASRRAVVLSSDNNCVPTWYISSFERMQSVENSVDSPGCCVLYLLWERDPKPEVSFWRIIVLYGRTFCPTFRAISAACLSIHFTVCFTRYSSKKSNYFEHSGL